MSRRTTSWLNQKFFNAAVSGIVPGRTIMNASQAASTGNQVGKKPGDQKKAFTAEDSVVGGEDRAI